MIFILIVPTKVRADTTLSTPLGPDRKSVEALLADEAVTHVIRTFKYRILPRNAQHRRLQAALDHTRDLYNAALEERISIYRKTGKSAKYVSQCRGLTELRADAAYAEFPTTLQRWPLKKLDLAFAAFFRRVKAGEKPGFPRFKGRDWFKTFGFSDKTGWYLDDTRLYVKGIGRIKLHLHRQIPSKPIACQIKCETSGWVALLVCKVPIDALPRTGRTVGIDLGITAFIATSDGEAIPGFHAARRAQKTMRRRQRAMARCKRRSHNRRKAKARLATAHEKIGRSRRTFHHQIAARIIHENDTIAIENLNIKGLAKGILARDVNDAGWASFANILAEKAEKAARTIIKVDPKFTSQDCSGCGERVPKSLAQRTHSCPHCGLVMDRDENAARNVLHRAVLRPGALQLRESLA